MDWIVIIFGLIIAYSLLSNKGNKKPVKKQTTKEELSDFKITITTSTQTSTKSNEQDWFNSFSKKSTNKTPGKWIAPGVAVKVGKREIKGGLFYFGGRLKDLIGYDTESSLVDSSLKVNFKKPDNTGDLMGYWPSYSHISPESRAAYLEWLSSDRNDPHT